MHSAFLPVKKSTLMIPSSPDGRFILHLFIVLTNPVNSESFVLLVDVSSIHGKHYDDACVLNVGDHPFVVHPSYIQYRYARIERADFLVRKVEGGAFLPRTPVSDALYDRIVQGLFKSRFVRRKFVEFYKQNGDL